MTHIMQISFLGVGGGGFSTIEKNFFSKKSCIGAPDIPLSGRFDIFILAI